MASQIEGDSRKHADAQDSTSVSWHLYHIHAACFVGRTFSKNSLDDIRIFRECIARLPRSEMTKIVTTIQTVRYRALETLPVSDHTHYPNSYSFSALMVAR